MVDVIDNKNFYPTPPALIARMIAKINKRPELILEPSAGKGNIVAALNKHYDRNWGAVDVSCIEIDPDLQATLRGHEYKLIDTDFLAYTGPDKFDLIIANPPFDEGQKHLLKAIDIMYCGQIIFILNAETIRNPHTNSRRDLVKKLDELGATIEFIPNAFMDAERKTAVEVALIDITINRRIEDDLFAGCEDHQTRAYQSIEDKHEVSTGKTIEDLVAEYNEVIRLGTETLLAYYRNVNKVGKYLTIVEKDAKSNYRRDGETLTKMLQDDTNRLLKNVRVDFWRKILNLEVVYKRTTKQKMDEFEHQLRLQSQMDFTESNIRQFILNLMGGYEQTLVEAVMDLFDRFTVRHCYHGGVHEKNVHYYSGWCRNSAFKINKRIVIPIYGSYGGAFWDDSFKRWKLNYETAREIGDFDKVLNYFGGERHFIKLADEINRAIDHMRDGEAQTSGITSTYFTARVHKKNTIHLTFNDDDLLRKFNVVAARGKGWLPGDFGMKPYHQLTHEEKAVVDSFEGKEEYEKHVGQPLFAPVNNLAQIGFAPEQQEFEFKEAA